MNYILFGKYSHRKIKLIQKNDFVRAAKTLSLEF
jgi:hypothetical protein